MVDRVRAGCRTRGLFGYGRCGLGECGRRAGTRVRRGGRGGRGRRVDGWLRRGCWGFGRRGCRVGHWARRGYGRFGGDGRRVGYWARRGCGGLGRWGRRIGGRVRRGGRLRGRWWGGDRGGRRIGARRPVRGRTGGRHRVACGGIRRGGGFGAGDRGLRCVGHRAQPVQGRRRWEGRRRGPRGLRRGRRLRGCRRGCGFGTGRLGLSACRTAGICGGSGAVARDAVGGVVGACRDVLALVGALLLVRHWPSSRSGPPEGGRPARGRSRAQRPPRMPRPAVRRFKQVRRRSGTPRQGCSAQRLTWIAEPSRGRGSTPVIVGVERYVR